MKHANFTYISLIVFLLLGISLMPSCDKDKVPCTTCPTGNTNCENVQNVKNFFAFKVGSWWVYEEETSGARDSVYVTEYSNNPSNYDFDVRVYSTYQDYYYHFWPVYYPNINGCPENGSICKRCISVKHSKYKPGDFVSETKCFFFTLKVGNFDYESHSSYPNNKMLTEFIHTTFVFSTFEFGRTVVMYEDNSLMENDEPTRRYYSENIGIVRKELLDSNQIWNLVNYYIQE